LPGIDSTYGVELHDFVIALREGDIGRKRKERIDVLGGSMSYASLLDMN
jgi:hypothetical protein